MSDDDQHIDNESNSPEESKTPEVDPGALLGDQESGQEEDSVGDDLSAISSDDGESLLSDGGAHEALDESSMDERLDAEVIDAESPLDAATLEAITDDEVIVPQGDATGESSAIGMTSDEVDALLTEGMDDTVVPDSGDDAPIVTEETAAVDTGGDESSEAVDAPVDEADIGALLAGADDEEDSAEVVPAVSVAGLVGGDAEESAEVSSEVAGENIAAGAAPEDVLNTPEMPLQAGEQPVAETRDESEEMPEESIFDDPDAAVDNEVTVSVEDSAAEEETPAPEDIAEESVSEVSEAAIESVEPEIIVLDEETSGSKDFVVADASLAKNLLKVPGALFLHVRDEPWRALTGMAAGLIAAMSTFFYISMNELRDLDDVQNMQLSQDSDLQRSITMAEYLIEEGEYVEASSVIAHALDNANPKSPLYIDAEYVKLEAELKALPEVVKNPQGDIAHGQIDHVVAKMPLHPKRSRALFWKGQLYEAEDNMQAARVEYRELLIRDPNAPNRSEILLALGKLELETERPVEAARHLQQLRSSFPGTDEAVEARLLIGDAYTAIKDYDNARATFIAIAETHPGDKIGDDAFARLGELAYESGNYEQAIRELEGRLNTARSVEGNDGVTLLLAKAYRASGRLEEAKNLLNGLIDFFPTSLVTPLARVEMAQVLDELGLSREAVRYATQSVQLFPAHPSVLRVAGELLAKSGDAQDAARSLIAAQHAGADDPDLLLNAGRLYAKSGDSDEAKKAFEQLLYNYPKTHQGILGNIELSKLSFSQGMPSDAVDRLEELRLVVRGSSKQLPLLMVLGNFYSELGMRTKVADTYGEIATLTQEPELLAQSAIALFSAGVSKEGLTIADTVEVQQLSEETAYAFLNAKGLTLLQVSAKEGISYMEQAYAGYPEQRTALGVQTLLEANLTLNRSARARALVAEINAYVSQRENFNERPRLEQAAMTWGNYLYERQDFRAAASAYEMALNAEVRSDSVDVILTDTQAWNMFQQANALYRLSDYETCIPLYEQLATTASQWAPEASAKLTSARLEQRMRGVSVPEVRNAG